MDQTKEIRVMLEEAKEIQKAWVPQKWDLVYYHNGGHFNNFHLIDESWLGKKPVGFHDTDSGEWTLYQEVMVNTKRWHKLGEFDELVGIYLWHPSQAQYQEMLGMSLYKLALNILGYYNSISNDNWGPDDWMPKSMEQLLCYMVMVSNHQKVWTGKEYIKEVLT